MKKLAFTVLLMVFVLSGGTIAQVSESQAHPVGGPCSTAEMYNWENPHWNLMCLDYIAAIGCWDENGWPCDD